jgi:hypothetical protein
MFLSARHKPMMKEAREVVVVNMDTGEKIPRVIWANDETGRYRQLLENQFGNIFVECVKGRKGYRFQMATKVFSGNIKIVKKAELEKPS